MREDIAWLEPYPDSLLPATASPEETLRLHESIQLAFVRAIQLQLLPPRQRAILILHDAARPAARGSGWLTPQA